MNSKARVRAGLATFAATAAVVATLAAPASAATDSPTGTATATGKTMTTTLTLPSGHQIIATSTNGVAPQIVRSSCGGKPNWVHLYTTYDGDICFGYTGTYRFNPAEEADDICFGNNSGGVGLDPNPYDGVHLFVKSITITGWSGNDTCYIRV